MAQKKAAKRATPGAATKAAGPSKRAKPRKAVAPAAPAARQRPAKAAKPAAKKADAKEPAPKKAPARRPPGSPPIERKRVVVAMDVYEPNKDAVKAPLKEAGLKWNFLGEGKGLYKREDGGVHCFTQFKDDGVHYSLWGSDTKARDAILAAWRKLLGEERWRVATAAGEQAVAAEKAEQETEAVRLWRMAEPQRRPGEPDLFFQKRMAEWQAKRPA